MITHYHSKKTSTANQTPHLNKDLSAMRSPLYFSFIFCLAIIPLFIHSRWITGVLVNFILVFSSFKYGLRAALPLAFLPSISALLGGLIPPPMIYFIPFIIAANVILIAIVHFLKTSHSISVVTAAFSKFLFLFVVANYLATNFLSAPIVAKLIQLMSWHQLATAMLGGLIAIAVIKGLSYRELH